MEIPKNYKTILFQNFSLDSFEFVEKETPTPKQDEVLIQVFASPINPSDIMFVRGLYGIRKKPPFSAGFEGSGIVVSVGEKANFKVGDKVSFVASNSGTWGEYTLTSERNCLPIHESLNLNEASMLFVNPLTCYALFELAQELKTPSIVQTAAASALGKMMIRLCKEKQVPLINIVRREDQVLELKNMGAEFVLNSEKENFEKEFYKLSKKLNSQVLFDAVGGNLITRLFPYLPYGGKIISYGNLSEQNFEIPPALLIFQKKSIEGFWLSEWLSTKPRETVLAISQKTQELYEKCFFTNIEREFPLFQIKDAIEYYQKNMSKGKVLIKPSLR